MRRVISLALAMLMVVSCLTGISLVSVSAAGGTAGRVVISKIDFEDGSGGFNSWGGSVVETKKTDGNGYMTIVSSLSAEQIVTYSVPSNYRPAIEYWVLGANNNALTADLKEGKNYYLTMKAKLTGRDTAPGFGQVVPSVNGKQLSLNINRVGDADANGWYSYETKIEASNIPAGGTKLNGAYFRSGMASMYLRALADTKSYAGTGLGNKDWLAGYKFTIDGIEHTLAEDCSKLGASKEEKVATFQKYLDENPIEYQVDDYQVEADATLYDIPVTIDGAATVEAVTNSVTGEKTTLNANGNIKANDYFNVDVTVKVASGSNIESIKYGDETIRVNNANEATFTIRAEDVDSKTLAIKVESITADTPFVDAVTIKGALKVGSTLEADYNYTSTSADASTYKWQYLDGETWKDIEGATAKTYTVKASDDKKTIRVVVSAKNEAGKTWRDVASEGYFIGDVQIFVAADGDDANGNGSIDKPFATLTRARDEVREHIKDGLTSPIYVCLRGGDYRISSSLVLDERDSGTEEFPIVYRAYNNEEVNVYGSKELDSSKITKVTDEAVLNKLVEAPAREHLYQVKLSDLGISAPALTYNGQAGKKFYMNGVQLINARWPNADKSTEDFFIGGEGAPLTAEEEGKYNGGGQPVKMQYVDTTNRSANWEFKRGDLFCGGAMAFLWARCTLLLDTLDTENKIFKTIGSSQYGQDTYTSKDDRYLYFENLIEEIDVPGESYLDRQTNTLYFYPVGDVKDAKFSISELTSDMVVSQTVKNVEFDGINFVETAGNALNFPKGAENITIKNATIRGIANMGISLSATGSTVENCKLYDISSYAIYTGGGDRATLTSSEIVIKNNIIHSCPSAIYTAIQVQTGVGHVITNNQVYEYDMGAVRLGDSNNVTIENNEFFDCQLLNADGGVIYLGRNVSELGNIIRNNYFHHTGNLIGQHGQQAIFTDDGETGPAIYGNIFYQAGLPEFPIKTHAGHFHWIHDNIIIDNTTGVFMQAWGSNITTGQKRSVLAKWFLYMQDKGAPFGYGSSGGWAYRGPFMVSETWRNYYMNEEPTGQWKPLLEKYFTKENIEKVDAAFAANDKDELANIINTLPDEYTNKLYNNAFIGVKTPIRGGNYDAYNNASFSADEGKAFFKNYGSDFTLTAEGLAKLEEKIPGFEAPDFANMGLEASVKDTAAPSASNLSVVGTPKLGGAVTADYTFKAGADDLIEGTSKIKWYISDSKDGTYERVVYGYGPSLTITDDMVGKYVRYELIPVDNEYRYSRNNTYTSEAVYVNGETSDKDALFGSIEKANKLISSAEVGTKPGQYSANAVKALEAAVAEAREVANNASAFKHQVDSAKDALDVAIAEFVASVVPDETAGVNKASLAEAIAEAESFVNSAKVGSGYGDYSAATIAALNEKIASAKTVNGKADATQAEVNSAALALRQALKDTKANTNSSANVSSNGSFDVNYGGDKTELNVSSGATDVKLNVEKGAELPEIKMTSNGSTLEIKKGTTASDSFKLPIAGGKASARLSAGTLSNVYGSGSSVSTLGQLARVVLKGEGGKKAAYLNEKGTYTLITKSTKSDSFEAAESALNGTQNQAALITVGDDLVIYTKIMTEFVTYEIGSNSSDDDDNSGSIGGSNGGVSGGVSSNPYGNGNTNGFYSADTTNPNLGTETFCFDDMINHWARTDVMKMFNAGFVSGVSERNFEPDRNITRAEFAAIIARALGLKDAAADYKDVASTDWFAGYVGACTDAGIISGFDGMFRPNDNITRQEMAVIIVNAYTYLEKAGKSGGLDQFSDKAQIADWAKSSVDVASSVGLISGMGDGTFGPLNNATRAQAASLVSRIVK